MSKILRALVSLSMISIYETIGLYQICFIATYNLNLGLFYTDLNTIGEAKLNPWKLIIINKLFFCKYEYGRAERYICQNFLKHFF